MEKEMEKEKDESLEEQKMEKEKKKDDSLKEQEMEKESSKINITIYQL